MKGEREGWMGRREIIKEWEGGSPGEGAIGRRPNVE